MLQYLFSRVAMGIWNGGGRGQEGGGLKASKEKRWARLWLEGGEVIGTISVCHYSAGDRKGAQKYVYFTPSAHVSSVGYPLESVDKFLLWTGNPQWNTQRSDIPRIPAVEVSSMAISSFPTIQFLHPWKSENDFPFPLSMNTGENFLTQEIFIEHLSNLGMVLGIEMKHDHPQGSHNLVVETDPKKRLL